MSNARKAATVPRYALRPEEAARSLGVELRFFNEHIAPSLPCARPGSLKLYPTAAVQRWLEKNAVLTLPEDSSR